MVTKLNEASFYDTIKNTVGKIDQARKDAKKNPLKNLTDAEEDEIKLSPTAYEIYKEFKKARSDYDVQIDPDAGKLQATFDARKVPTSLVDDFKAQGKYDKYVTTYDPKTKEVTMLFDIEAEPATESVMAPTPTPYKYKPAKAPKSHDDLLDESLLDEDLTMTSLEPFQIDGSDDLGLRTEINGRSYDFTMKDDSPFSAEQMLHKINKMMQFSKGKALAFLKKYAVGTRTASSLHESGNPFKSSFICQGCGKPLDQCTCEIDTSEIEDEDEDTQIEGLELMTEDNFSSSATQSSNIGSYKRSSIDLIPMGQENEEEECD